MILCLQILAGNEIYFTQESFYLQGILNDITEQDISSFDCKYMMKSAAPPDESRSPAPSVN